MTKLSDKIAVVLLILIPLGILITGIYSLFQKKTDPTKKKEQQINNSLFIVLGIVALIASSMVVYQGNKRNPLRFF